MVAARNAGCPYTLPVVSAGIQVVGVELVEASSGKAQAMGHELGFEFAGSEGSQQMTDQWSGTAMKQLPFFSFSISERSRSGWGCPRKTARMPCSFQTLNFL